MIFGSKSSTTGRLMSEFYLQQQFQKSSVKIFSRVGYSVNHSRTIALVQSGAVNYQVWEQELAEGKIDVSKVKIIWTAPDYPDYHWTARGELDFIWGKGFTTTLRQALLDMDDPDLFDAFPRNCFMPTNNGNYHAIAISKKRSAY